MFSKSQSGGQRIDCVIHFAALKAVGESCALPLKYYGNNVTGSANLMEVMMEFGVTKIVFPPSATVYGQPQYLPVDEKHPTGNCTNPYGKTKFFMEEIIKVVIKESILQRPRNQFNPYSPRTCPQLTLTGAAPCSDTSTQWAPTHPAWSARTPRERPTILCLMSHRSRWEDGRRCAFNLFAYIY